MQSQLDLLWLLLCSLLVFGMQAGFLCLESGLTRQKNSINVALKNVTDFVVSCAIWWGVAFGIAFGLDLSSPLSSQNTSYLFHDFAQAEPELGAFFIFQMMFCATAATIVSGAIAERTRFAAYHIITAVIVALIYPVVTNWVWGNALGETGGWLAEQGFVDFAGSTVVHGVGGWVALAAILVIGARRNRYDNPGHSIPSSNLSFAMLGILFLCAGWVGFNGGSTFSFDRTVPSILINTMLAASAGGFASYIYHQFFHQNWIENATVPLNGVIAGLVAITASCHAVSSAESVLIGAIGGVLSLEALRWMNAHRIDDAIAAVPVHLVAGIWGTLAVALFADLSILGTGLGRLDQLMIQAKGIVVIGLWSFLTSLAIFYLLDKKFSFRVSEKHEIDGLNVSEHGAHTPLTDLFQSMKAQSEAQDMSMRLPEEPFTEVGQIASRQNRLLDSLERAQLKSSAIVSEINAGIVTLDERGLVASFNPAAEKIFDCRKNSVMQKAFTDFFEPESIKDLTTGNSIPVRFFSSLLITSCQIETSGLTMQGGTRCLEIIVSDSSSDVGHVNCLVNDISDRKSIERILFAETERSRITLDAIADGVITTDEHGLVDYLNVACEQISGWSNKEARGEKLCRVFPILESPEDRPKNSLAEYVLAEKKSVLGSKSHVLVSRSGETQAINFSASPIFDEAGKLIGMVVVFQDVTKDKAAERKLNYLAKHDSLTGLINRYEFEQVISKTIQDSEENGQSHVAGFLDMDQFKIINDICGHAAGDALLKQLAALFLDNVRSSDIVARIGGDEFGIVISDCDMQEGKQIAEKIKRALSTFRFSWEGKSFSIASSIGLTSITPSSSNTSDVLNSADAACYRAKNSGRNCIHIYEPDDDELAERHSEMVWASKIRTALEQNQFCLHYQCIAPAKSPEVSSHFEILVRMLDDDGTIVPPGRFIPAAERYHLISSIDEWVVKETLSWIEANRSLLPEDFMFAINLSGESIGRADFLDFVTDIFEATGINPACICFEITETAAIANMHMASRFVQNLKALGCYFALDDFGSGLSSFGYLKNLAVDYLKIDGCFVKEVDQSDIDQAMVEAINNVGQKMGLKTIAEFVESEAILRTLENLNVDYVQGFYINKPQPLSELIFSISNTECEDLDGSIRQVVEVGQQDKKIA